MKRCFAPLVSPSTSALVRGLHLLFILIAFFSIASKVTFFAYAEAPSIIITPQEEMVFDQDQVVVVELTDESGRPLAEKTPEITFSPIKSVEQVELFDCTDPAVYDNCQANNRGVDGIFESHFVLIDAPVTMTVKADDAVKQIVLQGVETAIKKEAEQKESEKKKVEKTVEIQPSAVQVGPQPSAWYLLLPLAIITAAITVFVVKTTNE